MLEVKDLVAGYSRETAILNGVHLQARDGEVTLILGPNGAGKSTLLKTIYGYLQPRRGEILFANVSIAGGAPKDMLRRGIAYLIQGHSIFPAMTVEENLLLGGWILRGRPEAVRRAFDQVYARFPRLAERRRAAAGLLSGGEQRMLELARLTMTGPKLLLLDEPSVGLMPKLVDQVYGEILKLKSERFTIIIVDQNVKKAIHVADHVVSLRLGRNSHEGRRVEFEDRLPEIVKEWL